MRYGQMYSDFEISSCVNGIQRETLEYFYAPCFRTYSSNSKYTNGISRLQIKLCIKNGLKTVQQCLSFKLLARSMLSGGNFYVTRFE